MKNVTPILTATPPDSTRERPDGAYSNNPAVRARKGMPEHVAWAYERENGGRGFGFTGGHWNWANDGFRKTIINGILWTTRLDVPEAGFDTPRPTIDELLANQDEKPNKQFKREAWKKRIEQWSAE